MMDDHFVECGLDIKFEPIELVIQQPNEPLFAAQPLIKVEPDEELSCGIFIVEPKQELGDYQFESARERRKNLSSATKNAEESSFVLLDRLEPNEIKHWTSNERKREKRIKNHRHKRTKLVKTKINRVGMQNERKRSQIDQVCTCDHCGEKFNAKAKISEHILSTHKTYHCDVCKKLFPSQLKLKFHMIRHENDEQICHLCGKVCKNRAQLRDHKKAAHLRQKRPCKLCGKLVKKMSDHLSRHRKPEVRMSCEICGKMVKQESMPAHIQNVHKKESDGKLYPCEQCLDVFTCRDDLRIHKTSSHDIEKYECEVCKRQLSSIQAHGNHMKRYHPQVPFQPIVASALTCNICGGVVKSLKSLKNHMERHRNPGKINPVSCQICGKIVEKAGLEKHIQNIHVKVNLGKTYSCEQCSEEFTRINDLRSHKLAEHHNQNSLLQCHICQKPFGTQKSLSAHNYFVHRDKFECAVCGKKFTSKKWLIQHMETRKCKRTSLSLITKPKEVKTFENPLKDVKPTAEVALQPPITSEPPLYRPELLYRPSQPEPSYRPFIPQYQVPIYIPDPPEVDTMSEDDWPFDNQSFDDQSFVESKVEVRMAPEALETKPSCDWFKYEGQVFETKPLKREIDLQAEGKWSHQQQLNIPGYSCDFCGQTFAKRMEIAYHFKVMHRNSNHQHKCTVCGRGFKTQGHMILHIQVHSRQPPLISERDQRKRKYLTCDFCGNEYRKDRIARHMRNNHGKQLNIKDRPLNRNLPFPRSKLPRPPRPRIYPCRDCDRAFTTENHLRRHIGSDHLPTSSRICEHCGLHFEDRRKLYDHRKSHDPNRDLKKAPGRGLPTQCTICGKMVKSMGSHLKDHKLAGQKAACKICGKIIGLLNMKRHMRHIHSKTPRKRFPCEVCGKDYNRDEARRLHLRTIHKINV